MKNKHPAAVSDNPYRSCGDLPVPTWVYRKYAGIFQGANPRPKENPDTEDAAHLVCSGLLSGLAA